MRDKLLNIMDGMLILAIAVMMTVFWLLYKFRRTKKDNKFINQLKRANIVDLQDNEFLDNLTPKNKEIAKQELRNRYNR